MSLIPMSSGWQDGVVPRWWRNFQETLGGASEPSKDEERMLARAVAAFGDAGQRGWTDGMVLAPLVEQGGLVPDLVRDLSPTERVLRPLGVHCCEHGNGVEV